MGFIEKLRNELVDVVEWIDDSRSTLVWRFPRYHNQIKQGAKLIVRPGQVAIFVHQGRLADVFPPGTHVLDTGNLPILSTLQGWKYGFDSPIKSEIYYVSTRQISELRWGTPKPVIVKDPQFGAVRVRAFGSYTLRVKDPQAILKVLVGTDGQFDADEINVLLRSLIANAFAEVVGNSGLGIVDLAARYAEFSETVRADVAARIDDEFGLEMPVLAIMNISLPEEVEKAIDTRTGMNAIGDMEQYRSYQISNSVGTAAANPAGGLAAAGVGVGLGFSMLNGMTSPEGRNRLSLVPPVPGAQPAVWHVAEHGQSAGPFTIAQLSEAAAQGRFNAETLVWRPGMPGWKRAAEVDEVAHLIPPPPPPLPAE